MSEGDSVGHTSGILRGELQSPKLQRRGLRAVAELPGHACPDVPCGVRALAETAGSRSPARGGRRELWAVWPAQSAPCCPPHTRSLQSPPRGMREPLVPARREAGGVRGVAGQRASAAVEYGLGKGLCYLVSGEGALLPGDRKRKPCCLVTGDGSRLVARRPEETLLPRDRKGEFLCC